MDPVWRRTNSELEPRLLDRLGDIDLNDPAITHVVRAIATLKDVGFDLDDPGILEKAIEAGRKAYEEDQADRPEPVPEPLEMPQLSNVYYMRLGNRVKIGFTTRLKQRLAELNAEELLATEPGDRRLEHKRHEQFRDLRTTGEWFRLEGALIRHIDELREGRVDGDYSHGLWTDRPRSLEGFQ